MVLFHLTFFISWPIWAIGNVFLPENTRILTTIAGAYGSFFSAMIILRITAGGSGLKDWLRTTF